MRLILLVFSFLLVVNLNAKSAGWKYYNYMRTANDFSCGSKSDNIDSAFYYYEKVWDLGSKFRSVYLPHLELAFITMDTLRAKRYLLNAAENGLASWNRTKHILELSKLYAIFYFDGNEAALLNWDVKLSNFCSKREFKESYKPYVIVPKNKALEKVYKKAESLISRNKRGTHANKVQQRKNKAYRLIRHSLDELGRIPTYELDGFNSGYLLSKIIDVWTAQQIVDALPMLLDGIHDGSYFFNNRLAKRIDYCANFEGDYIRMRNGSFYVFHDTTYQIANWGYYGYLGENFIIDKAERYYRGNKLVAPLHPDIELAEVNQLLDTLCLPTVEYTFDKEGRNWGKAYYFEMLCE